MSNQQDNSNGLLGKLQRVARVETTPEARVIDNQQRAELFCWYKRLQVAQGLKHAKMIEQHELPFGEAQLRDALRKRDSAHRDLVLRALKALRNTLQEWATVHDRQECVATTVAKEIRAIVATTEHLCQQGEDVFGLIVGPAGAGKSMVLKAYALQRRNSIYMAVDQESDTPMTCLQALCRRVGIADKAKRGRLFLALVRYLVGTETLLIVDEAHQLDKRGLNLIRELQHRTRCPVVIAGMPDLKRKVKEGQNDEARGATLYSRLGPRLDMGDRIRAREVPAPDGTYSAKAPRETLHSIQDVIRVFASNKLRLTRDALELLHTIVNLERGGMFRTARILVATAQYANPGAEEISDALLLEAAESLETVDELSELCGQLARLHEVRRQRTALSA